MAEAGWRVLERFLERWQAAPVRWLPARCVRARHRLGDCRACAEACPCGAILFGEAGGAAAVRVDGERCLRCGLCLAACPTEALRWEGAPPAPTRGPEGRRLRCTGAGPARPGEEAIPCLGALDLPALLESAARPLLLIHGDCAACPLARGRQAFAERLGQARRLAAWSDLTPLVGLCEERPGAPGAAAEEGPPVSRPAPGGGPRLSRRDLFRLAGREAGAGALAALPVPSGEAPPALWSDGHLPRATGSRRRRLAPWWPLAAGGPEGVGASRERAEGLPLWRLGSSAPDGATCQGCGLCAELCPEEALRLEQPEGGGRFRLLFEAWRCSGCGLCTAACPSGFLRLEPGLLPLEPGPAPLAEGELARCALCGTPFRSEGEGEDEDGGGLCPACRETAGRRLDRRA
ncbi:MAG: 4Fe-4S dicluster domain-containing protein [Firmicutes bacterium]|nr:4Fe-4S dicluster domain-containing protein [Bacillota bacterium]